MPSWNLIRFVLEDAGMYLSQKKKKNSPVDLKKGDACMDKKFSFCVIKLQYLEDYNTFSFIGQSAKLNSKVKVFSLIVMM